MTWAASAWALTVPMPTSSKFVLLVLANFTDENESCFPGVSRLAETTGYSERSIKSCLALLEDEGLISRERRYTRFGGRTSDRYVLNVGGTPRSVTGSAAETPPDSVSSVTADICESAAKLACAQGRYGSVISPCIRCCPFSAKRVDGA